MDTETKTCFACLDEMCFQCYVPNDETLECCCGGSHGRTSFAKLLSGNSEPAKLGRPFKENTDLVDYVSAGRKRAAELAPIPEDYTCEWAMLQYAGGGVEPIVGCAANLATDRHHGPDKNTLNNTVGINLHRICADCHNRWHQLNDIYYGERPEGDNPFLPVGNEISNHDRTTRATPKEVMLSNVFWKKPVLGREPYRAWEKSA